MGQWVREIFTLRDQATEERTILARQLNGVYLSTIVIFVGLLIAFVLQGVPASTPTYWVFSGLALAIFGLWLALRRGYIRRSAAVFISLCFVGLVYSSWVQAGVRDAAFIGLTAIILLASVALGQWGTILMTLLSILAGYGLAYVEWSGWIEPLFEQPFSMALYMTAVFLANAIFAFLSVYNLNASLIRARTSRESLLESNRELDLLRAGLEQQVEERTAELAAATGQSQRRAAQFEAVARVARTTTAHRDPAELLPDIARMVADLFDYDHVAIFLLNENGRSAILRAANSPEGQNLLARKFQVEVGKDNLIGWVSANGQPRFASDVEPGYVNLPETRSEATLPLKAGDRIIGVLDLQSKKNAAFDAEDIEVLSILADQIAIAIENARLFSDTAQALSEARTVYGQYLRQAWQQLPQETQLTGFQYIGSDSAPLDHLLNLPEIQSAVASGLVTRHEDRHGIAFAVPLKLRDQIIGVLDIRNSDTTREWTENQTALVQAVADRVALALENARLFEETTRRADRERTVSEITTKIRGTTDPQSMLELAMEELRRALGARQVQIRPYAAAAPAVDTPVKQPPAGTKKSPARRKSK
ncbi:MAG: GAF domain-containing protein [Anaerolineales bacterium]|nr:GAF domain-containing protein [Anaerolineales bacterium]